MTSADELLELAGADPRAALERGHAYLAGLDDSDSRERSKVLRALSLAARATDLGESVELARSAVEVASDGSLEKLRLMAMLTLAGSLAMSGFLDDSLRVIEEGIEQASDDHLLSKFTYQRGALLSMLGRHGEAMRSMEAVLPTFRELEDVPSLVLTLNQLGLMNISLGNLREAEPLLQEASELAPESGERQAGIKHNLGLLAAYRGDIPTALERLQESDDLYMERTGAEAPEHVARSEVLLGVGRFEEAFDLAREIADWNHRSGDKEHEANALLVAAQAALMLGETSNAISLAHRAAELLGEDMAAPRALEARRVGLEARYLSESPSPSLLDEAASLAATLQAEGHVVAGSQANLLAGRIALALGEAEAVDRHLEPVSAVSYGPVELRLQARLARALQRKSRGDARGASAAARSGLRLMDRYQKALGATDLRMGLERHGAELGEIGLGLALQAGRPRPVLDWMELTRARALRFRPVIPDEDDGTSRLLGELRRVEAELRSAASQPGPSLIRERNRLQEEIARADRVRAGAAGDSLEFSVDRLVADVGDRTLIELGEHGGLLFAVLVSRGRARLVDLEEAEPVHAELGHLRFGMRRAARRGRPVDEEALVRLDGMLFDGIDPGDDVVVIPPPSLMASPWAALPTLRGRSITLSPSAEMWWRARHRDDFAGPVLVAGGPDLTVAEAEVAAVGGLYERPRVLAPGCGVEDVRSGLVGASVAHIACHATFRADNPMFSSLRLGDGDLNVYDIERLANPPSTVVLSACDSGYTEARSGGELAGLTSALLSMGARSVVASVGLVPDTPATSELMVSFHRGLIRGLPPGEALAAAQSGVSNDSEGFIAASSFVCVGA